MSGKMKWNRVKTEKREQDARAKGFRVPIDDARFEAPPAPKRPVANHVPLPEIIGLQEREAAGLKLTVVLRGSIAASIMEHASREGLEGVDIVERALKFYLAPRPRRRA